VSGRVYRLTLKRTETLTVPIMAANGAAARNVAENLAQHPELLRAAWPVLGPGTWHSDGAATITALEAVDEVEA
jgi:hypothetical protein